MTELDPVCVSGEGSLLIYNLDVCRIFEIQQRAGTMFFCIVLHNKLFKCGQNISSPASVHKIFYISGHKQDYSRPDSDTCPPRLFRTVSQTTTTFHLPESR